MKLRILGLLLLSSIGSFAQNTASLGGTILHKEDGAPIVGATITLEGTNRSTSSDSLGRFRITGIQPKTYTLKVTSVGFKENLTYNIIISTGNENNIIVQLDPLIVRLKEVTLTGKGNAISASIETPLSIQKLTSVEIQSNPGGNFDISRVIQALPGVSGTSGAVAGYRNDIIIRGGAPNENVYYLDGIELPVINHFSTQGSAGGPTGMINISFVDEAKVSSSAFDARYDNALSSVLQFRQRIGNTNRFQGNVRLSASELATTFEGPISSKTSFLASARRSYLQLLFKAIDLPIRPNYWDFQYKVTHRFNSKLTLTLIGIGAIDDFNFAEPKEATPEKLYILGATPSLEQWNYTVGAMLRKQLSNGNWTIALSRSQLDNTIEKFDNNERGNEAKRKTGIFSQEIENKLRFDIFQTVEGFRFSFGLSGQFVESKNNSFQRIRQEITDVNGTIIQPALISKYVSNINFWKFGSYMQIGKRIADSKLSLSLGVRTDVNSFTDGGLDPSKTISPRFSSSYMLGKKWTLNASIGQYYKIAPYTILSYRDNYGMLANSNSQYGRSVHYVIGTEFLPRTTTRFTAELFYKKYSQMPVSLRDGISLSNLGGDFGVVGNEAIVSAGNGDSYGIEFFAQKKLTKRFFSTVSLTIYQAKFSGLDGKKIASAWDNRQLLSFIGGYKFKRNWELGMKFRFQGGAPFTPFNLTASQLNYLTLGTGILDYSKLNTERLSSFHSADLRLDKRWNFKKYSIDLFTEILNVYNAKSPSYPQYTFKRNDSNTSFLTTNGQPIQTNGSNAIPFILNDKSGNVLPTIGFIVEF